MKVTPVKIATTTNGFLKQTEAILPADTRQALECYGDKPVVLSQTPGAWQEFAYTGMTADGPRLLSNGAPRPRGRHFDYAQPFEVYIFDEQGEPVEVVSC
jgi:hypothetical protein